MRARIGAIAWILTVQFFVVEVMAGLRWPGYNFLTDRISDLGALRSPAHTVISISLVIQGFLIAGGALALRNAFPGGRLRMLGISGVILNGAGVIAIAFVPEDANRALHDIFATVLILGGNLGMLALGALLLHEASPRRPLGAAAIALGALGLLGAIIFTVRPLSVGTIGAWEHLAVDLLPLWLLMAGATYLFSRTETL